MSIERARAHLARYGMESAILELPVSTATVDLAAQAVGVTTPQIAKTLSYRVKDSVILVVCAGDTRVDNKKFKARFGTRPRMLRAEEAEPLTGHAVGGVCPFGVKPGVAIYLDEALRRSDCIYPACGSHNSLIRLTPDELERCSEAAGWVDVTIVPEPGGDQPSSSGTNR